jgi:hypothetical protein
MYDMNAIAWVDRPSEGQHSRPGLTEHRCNDKTYRFGGNDTSAACTSSGRNLIGPEGGSLVA